MKSEAKISIIIPIFNCEKYLTECIQSIRSQTLKEYEVICINDCSSDHSFPVLEQLIREDSRFSVITNERRCGAGESRNRGFKLAAAPYVVFLDADDLFDCEMLEKIYAAALKHHADVVYLKMKPFVDSEAPRINAVSDVNTEKWNPAGLNPVYTGDKIANGIVRMNINIVKLIRREFLMNSGITFQSLSSSNDVKFCISLAWAADKIVQAETSKVLWYHRVNTPGQISANRDPLNICKAFEAVRTELVEQNNWDKFYVKFARFFLAEFLIGLKRAKTNEQREAAYNYLQEEGLEKLDLKENLVLKENLNIRENPNISMLPDMYKNYYQGLAENSFHSGWFENIDLFSTAVAENQRQLGVCFADFRDKGYRVGLFGMGVYGRRFLTLCTQYGWQIDYLLDSDPRSYGTMVENKQIGGFDEVKDAVDVILVTSAVHYSEILNTVSGQCPHVLVWMLEEMIGGL